MLNLDINLPLKILIKENSNCISSADMYEDCAFDSKEPNNIEGFRGCQLLSSILKVGSLSR